MHGLQPYCTAVCLQISIKTAVQVEELRELQAEWRQEYRVRRQMLIERAKVQSWQWNTHIGHSYAPLNACIMSLMSPVQVWHQLLWWSAACGRLQVLVQGFMWAHEPKHEAAGVTGDSLESASQRYLKIAGGTPQVLVQSFMWADKLKDEAARTKAQEAADRFTSAMAIAPDVLLEQVFAARQGAVPPCRPQWVMTQDQRPPGASANYLCRFCFLG